MHVTYTVVACYIIGSCGKIKAKLSGICFSWLIINCSGPKGVLNGGSTVYMIMDIQYIIYVQYYTYRN